MGTIPTGESAPRTMSTESGLRHRQDVPDKNDTSPDIISLMIPPEIRPIRMRPWQNIPSPTAFSCGLWAPQGYWPPPQPKVAEEMTLS